MKTRSHAILALAASAIFTTAVFAAPETERPAANTTGSNPSAAQQAGGQEVNQQQGQQAGREITQQIRQFAQDPKTACDKLFVLHTAVDNLFEVQLSQQAEQRAESQQVKQMARQFVQDHEKMGQQLQQTARQLSVQIPQALPEMKQEELQIFGSLSGREYDQHYVATLLAGHAMTVSCFEAASSLSQNAEVKQFATENLPTLRQHYHMVRQEANTLGIMTHEGGSEATPAGARIRGADDTNAGTGNRPEAAPGAGSQGNAAGANGTNSNNPASTGTPSGNSGTTPNGTGGTTR